MAKPRVTTSQTRQPNGNEGVFSPRALGLIGNLAMREVKSQYNRTILGRLWSLLNPIATIAVFAVIFGLVFRGDVAPGRASGIDSFALWIAIGVLCWSFISGAIMTSMSALTANSSLLTKVYFPRYTLVVSTIIAAIIQFAGELLILVVLMAIAAKSWLVFLMIPALVVLTLLASLFALGLGLLLSVAVVYFRDIQHLWGIFNQVWMYASGVVFPITMLADLQNRLFNDGVQLAGQPLPLTAIFQLNPAEAFLEAFRALLYDFTIPDVRTIALCLAWTVVSR